MIRVLGLAYIYALLLVMAAHAIAKDSLLFHSDPLSLATYVAAAATVVVPVLFALASPAMLLPLGRRQALFRFCSLAAAAIITAAFFLLAVLFFSSLFELGLTDKVATRPRDALGVIGVILLPIGVLIWRHKHPEFMVCRVGHVGLAILVAIVVGLPLSVGYHHLFRASAATAAEGGERHLVMLVLDGMPAQYLTAYDPGAIATPIDRVVDDALVFRQMRTSATWTHGFFGTLYTGRSEPVFGDASVPDGSDRNLLSWLQRSGVAARWMAYHRNGIPEASAGRVNDYSGLRSYFLTHNYAWIFETLGLDYHLTIAGPSISKNLANETIEAVFEALNKSVRVERNVLVDILLPQLRKQRRRAARTFSLFHIAWDRVGVADVFSENELPVAWEDEGSETPKSGATKSIRANDYRYGEEYEPLAHRLRRTMAVTMGALGRHLQAFRDALAADSVLRDTTVIITADHGNMFRKGRFWYGYHPNEEVVRVPFILFDGGRSGFDDRYFSTPDVTQSILDFFDAPTGLDPRALSIFGSREHSAVASVTMRSDLHSEWFLVVVKEGRKYVVNLHPDGDATTRVFKVTHFDEALLDEAVVVPIEIADLFRAELRRFGIALDEIHADLR